MSSNHIKITTLKRFQVQKVIIVLYIGGWWMLRITVKYYDDYLLQKMRVFGVYSTQLMDCSQCKFR